MTSKDTICPLKESSFNVGESFNVGIDCIMLASVLLSAVGKLGMFLWLVGFGQQQLEKNSHDIFCCQPFYARWAGLW